MISMSKLSSKFQVTIPNEIRDAIGAVPGDRILFQIKSTGEVVIRSVHHIDARELSGSLGRISDRISTSIQSDEYSPIIQDDLSTSGDSDSNLHPSSKEGDVK